MASPAPYEAAQALRALLRSAMSGTASVLPKAMAEPEWAALERLAALHGLVPWLLHSLPIESLDALPADLLARWRGWEQRNRLRVLANWSVAIRVMALIRGAGIRVVPIKGVALSQQLYGSPWLRPAGDVDLLIERSRVVEAHSVLQAAGFVAEFPDWEASPRQWQWILENQYDTRYRDAASGTPVEVHWRLHKEPLLEGADERWIDGELEVLEILGQVVQVLPSPVQYLLVMSHWARSFPTRASWLVDSWLALARVPPRVLQAQIKAAQAEEVHQRFVAARDRVLADGSPDSVSIELTVDLPDTSLRKHLSSIVASLRLKTSVRYKLAVLRTACVSPQDFLLIRFDPPWFWLYSALRVPMFVFRRCFRRERRVVQRAA